MMITINCLATIFLLFPINVIVSITMLDVIVVPSNPLCSRSGQTSRHETRQKTARKLEFFAKAMGMFGISDIETYPNMSKHVQTCPQLLVDTEKTYGYPYQQISFWKANIGQAMSADMSGHSMSAKDRHGQMSGPCRI